VSPETRIQEKLKRTKFSLLIWLLIVVVLTNAYKGLVETTLTLPPDPAATWSSVSQMPGFVFATTNDVYAETFKPRWADSGFQITPIGGLIYCQCHPAMSKFVNQTCAARDAAATWQFQNCDQQIQDFELFNIQSPTFIKRDSKNLNLLGR